MKRMIKVTALAVFGVVLAGSQAKAAPAGISVFHIHLVEMARQRGISIDEAARAALSWGITGVDLWFEQTEVELKESERLLAAGLKPASVVMIQDFVHTNDTALAERALAYAKRVGAKRIMLVPGFCKDGEDQATAWRALKPNLGDFLKRAERDGIDICLEDFDGAKVSVGSRAHLREAFAAFPSLGHVLDTGNYAFWKDDLLECVAEFRPRIRHVHVKDRSATNFWKSVAAGTGTMPVREALTDLIRGGYNGWFTIECFGSKNFWEDISLSAAFLARVCRNVAWTVPDNVP